MFNNALVRSLCSSSHEQDLRLSKQDWNLVLEANKNFTEPPQSWRGNANWGSYILSKLGKYQNSLNFDDSLELCCGNGFLYFSFREIKALENCECAFMDLSQMQCDMFKKRCEDNDFRVPRIICGDIGDLPFEDGSLNLVHGNSFLHHLPDVGLYLKEANRVLRQGGKFVAFHEPTPTAMFWETFPRALFKKSNNDSLTDIWLLKSEVITRLLREAGFKKIEIIPNGLVASLFVVPFQMLIAKTGRPYHSEVTLVPRRICNVIERLLPRSILLRYAPSLAIYAEK